MPEGKGVGKRGRAGYAADQDPRRKRAEYVKRRREKKAATIGPLPDIPVNHLLDALEPRRRQIYRPISKRHGDAKVDCRGFSFIDSPDHTLRSLSELVRADCKARTVQLNFLDQDCADIAPYMVLTLIEDGLAAPEAITGGSISAAVRRVLEATEISKQLKMKPSNLVQDDVWPIKIRSCRQSTLPGRQVLTSSHGQAASDFAKHVQEWLAQLGYGLAPRSEEHLIRLICEVLENGIIHSVDGSDGEAWLAGCMSKNDDGQSYTCLLAVISHGKSIYESMQSCSQVIRDQIDDLVRAHRGFFSSLSRWTPEGLWTLYALQDGVTRLSGGSDPRGGKGLMDLIDFFLKLGGGYDDESTAMAIVSGQTSIHISGSQTLTQTHGFRRLALNVENDLHKPPKAEYIKSLKCHFPGTIVTIRVRLDARNLERLK